ncbi:MAG: hypothetical protein IJC17_03430 [Clostridia bacterium]|nr:hypothetical protein [Clostridia bacterium]
MKKKIVSAPSAGKVTDPPETPTELINKYGRCNVQDTCGIANEYPQIAQGLPKNTKPKKWGEK